MKEQLEQFYKEYKAKSNAYSLALTTMYFDQATIAPTQGNDYSNQMMAILSTESFLHAMDKDSICKLEQLVTLDIEPLLKTELERLLKHLNESKDLPQEVFTRKTLAVNESSSAWGQCKIDQDYKAFIPYLKNVIDTTKEVLTYHPNKEKHPYEILLDQFELGMTFEQYDLFFKEIKAHFVPLIKEIQEKGKHIDDSILKNKFSIEQQEKFSTELCNYLKVDSTNCNMSTSHHPFTTFLSLKDVRMTTHYYEDILLSSIYSIIHEYGHALFGLQIDEKYEGSILSRDIGSAMHESQSRFLENHIGKNKAFWVNQYPALQQLFPIFKDVALDEFMDIVNVSKPSLIRTEADELTYPLHVMIRYEIEKELFNTDSINYENLNERWNELYKEYLGVVPSHDGEGILQDSHWSSGYFGYFPTYALGSAYAAQFYHTMQQHLDVDQLLESNQFDVIAQWLKENIHHHGGAKSANEILLEVTNEPFNPKYYIDYITKKYRTLYNL